MNNLRFLSCISALLAPGLLFAQTDISPTKAEVAPPQKIYSPYVERTANNNNFAEGVYWGDTHLHTKYSSDSGMIGNKLGPEEAYRFAKGEEVLTSSGQRWYDMVKAGQGYEAFLEWGGSMFTGDKINSKPMQRSVWDRQIEAAERHSEPGVFTALIGFEWTSLNTAKQPSNLHRVVLFRDGGDQAGKVLPFSAHNSADPKDLWKYMADYEDKTGGRVRAIPHNGNLSNGLMFSVERLKNGRKIDKNYAEQRMKWEPLYEVTQIKGVPMGGDLTARPAGDTVDVANASYLNIIGDAELRVVRTDPDFDPDIPRKHQERAYTSPIWYTP
jgi:hypothetical protein